LKWWKAWPEALLAACFLAFSWEVAYHLRWIATDGMLMQFGALTVLLAMPSHLRTRGPGWLYLAAVVAGLGMGTKYPGGSLLIPVLVAGYFRYKESARLVVHLGLVTVIVFITFIISTPAVLLRPAEVLEGMLYQMQHYASGHAGHTVSAGLEHGLRMMVYLGTVVFSPFPAIAISVFGLAVIGGIVLWHEEFQRGLLFLAFPVFYFSYFCMQRVMFVRNLLVLVPFLAVLAARGAGAIWKWTQPGTLRSWTASRVVHAALLTVIIFAGCLNAGWLFYAAETIANRSTDRFASEALRQIEKEAPKRFFLSPLVRTHFRQISEKLPVNVTTDAVEAERVLLYASEGLKSWRSWPANRADLTERWFGPYEVNFNIYANWWGDDRIIELTRQRANKLGILVCCNPISARKSDPAEPRKARAQVAVSGSQPSSGAIPDVEPCALVSHAEVEAILGTLSEGPRPGGMAADGTACAYVGDRPVVATIGVISTSSFDYRRSEPGNIPVSSSVYEMFVARTNSFRDVRLLARLGAVALMINVAAWDLSDEERVTIATRLATMALDRLAEGTP
jgi:hypothetical protein